MTWTRVKETGRGSIAWRVSVEGWPEDWVSHRDMVDPRKAIGLTGWSASDYYTMASDDLAGSDTMTVSILFRYGSGSDEVLLEHQDGAQGWSLYVASTGGLRFKINDGTTDHYITSAAVVPGTTYVCTGSFDGSHLRLVLDQTASTPVAVAGSFSAASTTAAMGAFAGGTLPASGSDIIGAALSSSIALSDAEMQAHHTRCRQRGRMEAFVGAEHLYRAPDLSSDLIGSADWTVNGSLDTDAVDLYVDSAGRKRVLGLISDGIEFSERSDPIRAVWDQEGFRVKIAGGGKQTGNAAAASFAPPTNRTWLRSEASSSATTIDVQSTAGFPSSGTIYIDSEAISYTGTSGGNQFTGCTRDLWSTAPQAHYVLEGEDARRPEVTDRPQVMDGRRCRIYAYGPGDLKTGDGTLLWKGVVSEDASFDGVTWAFTVDGLGRVLDVDLGVGLEDGLPLRGVYYSDDAPLNIQVIESSTTANVSTSWEATTAIQMSGFWFDNNDFCADLTANLQDALANHELTGAFTQTTVAAIPDGDSWAIEFTTDGTSPHGMLFGGPGLGPPSPCDGQFTNDPVEKGSSSFATPQPVVSASTVYVYRFDPTVDGVERPGTVPRTTVGIRGRVASTGLPPDNIYQKDSTSWPGGRLYVGGAAAISSDADNARLEWEANGVGVDAADDGISTYTVTSVSGSDGYIQLDGGAAGRTEPLLVATAANVPSISVGLSLGEGTLQDLIDTVTLPSFYAEHINRGLIPDIRLADFATSNDIAEAAAVSAYTQNRKFVIWAEVNLKDLIQQECRLLGVFPALDSTGSITFRKLRQPALSEISSETLTASTILVDDAFMSTERNALGRVNKVVYHTGYDPVEDKHVGDVVIVRDVESFGLSPRAITMEIKPFSVDPDGGADPLELKRLGQRILGTFGGPYRLIRLAVPLKYFDTLVGDIVALTWSKVPNATGGLGVSEKLGYVLERQWSPMEASGMLTILLTDQRAAGYSPAAKIDSITGTSGTANNATLTLSSSYLPSGTTAADFWTAGDKLRLFEWDSTTTTNNVTAVVVSATGTSLVVTPDSAWTYAGATWAVGSRVSTSITADTQKVYAYEAQSDYRVHWASSDEDPAFTLAS